ncbi:MAG: hypothetical protein IKF38_05310 [Clostridia bacterium]|nr:hypothetical protein [Clostridia bacterium]
MVEIKKLQKQSKGITLIALVVTIIVLLILAGVTISMITGGEGVIEKAANAKEQSEIAEEKDTISLAVVNVASKDKWGEISETELQKQLEDKGATVYKIGEEYKVMFNSNRIYTLDEDGKITDVLTNFQAPERKLSTQITDTSYGTASKQYEISCIEDLVDLSFKVNGIVVQENGTLDYTNSRNSFSGKYLVLTNNLNFKSITSYQDFTRKDYGDINGNGAVESLLIELTTGTGWIPIGGYNDQCIFSGKLNGDNKKIGNLYINNKNESTRTGFFGYINSASLENLNIEGNIYCNSDNAAGIIGNTSYWGIRNITNCSFEGTIENIKDNGYTAGITSYSGNSCEINECHSKGIIKGKSCTAGICAHSTGTLNISNCYNECEIFGGSATGGITGSGGTNISNCYNIGNIKGINNLGGIVGMNFTLINNCYNTGKIIGEMEIGGIAGKAPSNGKISRCYNIGTILGTRNRIGGILGYNHINSGTVVEQCYNNGDVSGTITVGGIVGLIGETGNPNSIYNCYNTGKVSGTSVAGIAYGNNDKVKFVSCYNTGELNSNTKYGITYKGNVENCYYLTNHGISTESATEVTSEQLKNLAPTLDQAFTIDEDANTITIDNTKSQNVWKSGGENEYPKLDMSSGT